MMDMMMTMIPIKRLLIKLTSLVIKSGTKDIKDIHKPAKIITIVEKLIGLIMNSPNKKIKIPMMKLFHKSAGISSR